jgi:hypothetical protein
LGRDESALSERDWPGPDVDGTPRAQDHFISADYHLRVPAVTAPIARLTIGVPNVRTVTESAEMLAWL